MESQVKNPAKTKKAQHHSGGTEPLPSDWDDVDLAIFLRIIYHKVLAHMFRNCKEPSHNGWAMQCGDDIDRIIYPGFILKTVDGEEAHYLNCCRAASALHPCPKCLAHKDNLAKLSETGAARTTESMRAVYDRAKAANTKSKREQILQAHGMHFVEVSSFPSICNTLTMSRTSCGSSAILSPTQRTATTSCIRTISARMVTICGPLSWPPFAKSTSYSSTTTWAASPSGRTSRTSIRRASL